MTRLSFSDRGFSLIELMIVVAIFGTVVAIAVPVMQDLSANIKLGEATRVVERELQTARLKAVSTNRRLRVRPNCPAAGYIRTVEVLGTAADAESSRCSQTTYPFPPSDQEVITRPNFDGPVRPIPNGATLAGSAIEFSPDGTARVAGQTNTIATEETLTITREGTSRLVTINGAGKVKVVQ